MAGKNTYVHALKLLREYPRVALNNLRLLPSHKRRRLNKRRSREKAHTHGRGMKGQGQRGTLPRLGFEGGNTPFYLMIPKESFYASHHLKREYPPISLLQLQRMIDTGRIDASQPIDITSFCNTGLVKCDIDSKEFGFQITEEGADKFQAQINLEVQWASQVVIAAIESNGGSITTRYYDPLSLRALISPIKYFMTGKPIPLCKMPPMDCLEYYLNAENRGYLADPEKLKLCRHELAQKYGYKLPDLMEDSKFQMLSYRKDPRQIFMGLKPGWVVNLKDKVILKPSGGVYDIYYNDIETTKTVVEKEKEKKKEA